MRVSRGQRMRGFALADFITGMVIFSAALGAFVTLSRSKLDTIEGQVASIQDFVPGCRFCQRLGHSGDTLQIRPPYEEVSPGHFLERCPKCTK